MIGSFTKCSFVQNDIGAQELNGVFNVCEFSSNTELALGLVGGSVQNSEFERKYEFSYFERRGRVDSIGG